MKLTFFRSRFVTLMALVTLIISGCAGLFPGGSSGGGGSTGLLKVSPIETTIMMPSGTIGLDPATLKVRTSCGLTQGGSDGKVGVLIFNGGPQYGELLNASGKSVMMGFISDTQRELSADSTARALVYLALAGPQMKAEGRLKLLEETHTLSGFSALVQVLEDQIKTTGSLDLADSSFQSALSGVVNGVLNRGRGVIVDPTSSSGLSMDTTVEGKLTVENVYLRRTILYMRRTGYIQANGTKVDDNQTPFTTVEMPLVARYGGITGTIDGYLKGEVPYTPVRTTPALDIPRSPADAKQTFYDLFAIGAGGRKGAAYAQLPIDAQNDIDRLWAKTLFLDLFLVFMANIALPLKGDQVDGFLQFVGGNAVITDIIGNLKSTVPQVGELMGTGDYFGALKALITSTYTSNTILPALAQVTLDFLDKNSNLSDAQYDQIFNGMSGLLEKMGKIDIGFTAADLSLLAFDIYRSNQADVFKIKVIPGKITLSADATRIDPRLNTRIHATIQDKDPTGTYEYRWSVSPNGNYWLDDSHLVGTDDAPDGILITADSTVTINSRVTTDGTAIAHCKAIRVDGGRQDVGESDITITFQNTNIITNNFSNYLYVTKVVDLPDGRFQGYYGVYIDLPMWNPRNAAYQYAFFGYLAGESFPYQFSLLEPITKYEFYGSGQYINGHFSGNVPGGVIRIWVRESTGSLNSPTRGAAQADADSEGAYWQARMMSTHPTTLYTWLR